MHVNIPQKLAILCQNSTTFTFEKYENMSLFEVAKNNAVVYFDQRLGAAFLVASEYVLTQHMHSKLYILHKSSDAFKSSTASMF